MIYLNSRSPTNYIYIMLPGFDLGVRFTSKKYCRGVITSNFCVAVAQTSEEKLKSFIDEKFCDYCVWA